jgi:hypothetical protein
MGIDLSQRGALQSQFVTAHEHENVKYEPILLSSEGGKYVVQEGNTLGALGHVVGQYGDVVEYDTPKAFFDEHGDPSQMVTLAEYRSELSDIAGLRDDLMHKAADIYNKAVDFGYAPNKIEYNGKDNYGRIERELNKGLNDNDLPDAVVEQINQLRGESNDLKHIKSNMEARLRDVESDLKERGLSNDQSSNEIEGSKAQAGVVIGVGGTSQ